MYMLSKISSIFTVLLLLVVSDPAFAGSTSAYLINGHKYAMDEDLFNRAVQEWYDANLDSIGFEKLVDSLANAYSITINEITFPKDIELIYQEDSTSTYDIAGKIIIPAWLVKATGLGCSFTGNISEMGIGFKANDKFENGSLQITDLATEIFPPDMNVSGNGNFLCPIVADSLGSYLYTALTVYLENTALSFRNISSGGIFDIFNPISALQLRDSTLIDEAFKDFPFDLKLRTMYDSGLAAAQLVAVVNFLTGTSSDPEAFKEVDPGKPVNPELHYGGFSFLYWVLQQGYPWHQDWSETQRINTAFNTMHAINIGNYRLEIRWRDLQKKVYRGTDLHPDSLSMGDIDTLITDADHWDTTAFTDIEGILTAGSAQNLQPFMAIGVGHQDRMPDDENGKQIAPATPDWVAPENYTGVSADEYLYNLKIYAHAVVKRFADKIDIWQIENELDAAGFASADPQWWRKGDLWQDFEFRDRVWQTLVQAVREEDPTALITHDLHMLGFMPAMESWIKDMDIVGVNFYPNQTTAIPVLGFMTGEYVWAVRRVLKGLGYAEKPVWLIETGYPGVNEADPPDSIRLEDDMAYFSENRQAAYIESAVTSAAENGADGFYYYSLTSQEDMPEQLPDLNKYIRYSGLIRRDTDEPKPGLDAFAAAIAKYITIIPTAIAEPENLPHTIRLSQNRPNPFNPTTVISWQMPAASHVELTVFNVLGEKVATLVSRNLGPGNYSVTFDGTDLASGIYYYRLIAGEFLAFRKMILLK
jgi:hypothetical protein